ncbi:hypothetical protein NL676_039327, partial [Syzygium grande]
GMFAGVKKIMLSELPNLIGKWHSELNPSKSYQKKKELNPSKSSLQLQSLVVDKCPSFIKAIPSKLMHVFDNLHTLQVCDCESLEEILDLEGLEAVESTRVLPQLRELNLVNLPKLRLLWNKDLQESLRFDSLDVLILYNCSNLGHAFTPSMARCLAHLCKIEIKECGQMEGVIIDEEGQGSAVENITFPHLNNLKLECLPNLTSFLLGNNHTLECPRLRVLTIVHCPKMRSLTWQSLMEIEHGTPSLFTPQVQFPQLKSMVLSHMDNLSKIWTNSPQETLTFDYLREVEVQNCKSLENLFPHWVATSLTQLRKLRVECCGIEEIVTSGDDTPYSNIAQVLFPILTSLVLHDMSRLKSFCPNFPTLNWPFMEELRVTHCDKLNMLSFATSMNNWAQRDDQRDLSYQEAESSFERCAAPSHHSLKKIIGVSPRRRRLRRREDESATPAIAPPSLDELESSKLGYQRESELHSPKCPQLCKASNLIRFAKFMAVIVYNHQHGVWGETEVRTAHHEIFKVKLKEIGFVQCKALELASTFTPEYPNCGEVDISEEKQCESSWRYVGSSHETDEDDC